MTYYRVEFLQTSDATLATKLFRTPQQGRNYAKRILGFTEDCDVRSKVNIVPVSRKTKT
ncbi:MAG: hypothetical protein LAO06_15550 [Acidobacteriia bacterium]|nr:hypothetical protein [Terriglobia bacterium]